SIPSSRRSLPEKGPALASPSAMTSLSSSMGAQSKSIRSRASSPKSGSSCRARRRFPSRYWSRAQALRRCDFGHHRMVGEVMEIMGDGILAIFNDRVEGGSTTACRNAFEAAKEGIEALAQSNETESGGVIQLVAGFALHHGTVAYGNIGFGNRLDFTVIG